jgi:hypothetical protein
MLNSAALPLVALAGIGTSVVVQPLQRGNNATAVQDGDGL